MKKTYIIEFTKKELEILTELILNELSENMQKCHDMTMFELVNCSNQLFKNQWNYVLLLKKLNKKTQIGGNEITNDEYNK